MINTLCLVAKGSTDNSVPIKKAANIIANGGLCAIPTETVYGLAVNALDENAIKRVFEVKGRPQDNPLIVHIATFSALHDIVRVIPDSAYKLAEAFWPGPLTIILPKSPLIPDIVTCGLDTVAVRIPQNPIARSIIEQAGVPVAAPSANLSGTPSATMAEHVINDLSSLIDAIVDGGPCDIGVESTVIDMSRAMPRLLRPGTITAEQIEQVIGKIIIDDATLNPLDHDQPAPSPGMKHKHYAPKTRLTIIEGDSLQFIAYANNEKLFSVAFEEECQFLKVPHFSLGSANDAGQHSFNLYNIFRKLDSEEIPAALIHYNCKDGLHMAVYNRILRAANFEKIVL